MKNNLWEQFEQTASDKADKTAIKDKSSGEWKDLTYAELEGKIRSLAHFLGEEGASEGDRIGIILENRAEWPLIFFSIILSDCVCVPINPTSSENEIKNIIKNSGCAIVFTSKDYHDTAKDCEGIDKVYTIGSDEFKNAVKSHGDRKKKTAGAKEEDLACIMYTSGTTSEPKGVMLTHKNILSNCDSLIRTDIITPEDSVISMLPLHHIFPFTVTMLPPLLYGGRVIYPGTMRREAVLGAIRESKSTVFVVVPQVLHSINQQIKEKKKKMIFPVNLLLSAFIWVLHKVREMSGINLARRALFPVHARFGGSFRFFVSGGAKLDEKVARSLQSFGFTVLEGYGLTESSPVLTLNPPGEQKFGSAGVPVPDVEIKIKDKNEEGVGEVIARGPNIMKGYYKKQELTEETLKDGWLHTGDLGYFDEDGYLFLTGRAKDVIVLSSGMNIYPDEIEEAYMSEAPVKEMCVFEVPSKNEGDLTLWAVVVPDVEFFKKYGEVNLKGVIRDRFNNVSKDLPGHMRLRGFTVTMDELPRTELGKIQRFKVKEKYGKEAREGEEPVKTEEELTEEDRELMETEHGRKIIDYLAEKTGTEREVTPKDFLEMDLGIDSLGRIEIAEGLEEVLGTGIKDEVVGSAFTVKDLIEGVEPFLGEEGAKPSKEGKEKKEGKPADWGKIIRGKPREENLEKIDLDPGWLAWLGGFIFIFTHRMLFKIFYRLKVEARENYPEEGPYIIYANHTSYFDGFLVASALPDYPRLELFFVGFRAYFEVPIIRNLVKIGRIIPLDFSSHLLESLKSAHYVLDHGKGLCLFPEGFRTIDGKVADFKKGFGILAVETQAKLVPVAIEGAFEAWPRTSKFPRLHPIKVTFGEAFTPEEAEKTGKDLGAEDTYEAVSLGARQKLIELKGEEDE
ncbi:MAG: AMP-binding protein [Candidatus Omnitrophica bacterium]|nr:AMP-binding protein [Candidatus Omnitrophota bacterium]